MNETIMGLILRIYVVVVILYKIYFCHISFPSIHVRNVYSNDVMSKYYDRIYNS